MDKRLLGILQSMDKTIKGKFNTIRDQHYNPNVKGGDYEKIVKEFLGNYFGGKYNIYERSSLLDTNLEIFNEFSPSENEFDIVATHKSVTPQIVIPRNGSVMVPYDATAFIVSVKQTLNSSNLGSDLDRCERLNNVKFSDMGPLVSGNFTIERPLNILFYFEGKITGKIIKDLIESNSYWDILIIVKSDVFISSGDLPITRKLTEGSPIMKFDKFALAAMLFCLPASIPTPLGGNTANLVYNLLQIGLEDID